MPSLLPVPDTDLGPEDLVPLRRFLVQLLSTKGADATVEAVLVLVARMLRDQAQLSGKLKALLRGRAEGGTERVGSAQLALWKEALEAALAEPEEESGDGPDADPAPPLPGADDEEPPKTKAKRKLLPANLPRRTVLVVVEGSLRICGCCGKEKGCIGHETSETLELVSARFEVVRCEREMLACATCPEGGVVTAAPVPKPLDGGIPGPALLADVVVRKAVDHTPINRLQGIYGRLGVDLPANTLYGWWNQAADKLVPIAEAIHARVLDAHLVQADDTGIRVLDDDTPDGSRRGHMWGLVGDTKWTSFRFTKTWTGEEMAVFLGARKGWLQGDGYAGYERLYRKEDPAIEVGCWSHARRYFVKAEDGGDKRARLALVVIGELFAVDAYATRHAMTPEERLALRQAHSPAILRRLWKLVHRLSPTITPSSPLGKAVTYLQNQRQPLERFLEDGRLPLENGAAERLARIVAVGRKNWLHAGSDRGAERLAVLYTVLTTARFHKVDLAAGLAFVFDRLARRTYTAEDAAELLPDRWPKPKVLTS